MDFHNVPLISRSSSYDPNSNATDLKRYSVQEAHYGHILNQVERVHFRESQGSFEADRFDYALAELRKLREALTSTMRYDAFAVEVYEKSASLCLTARNFPELLKSLISLVNVVYPEHLKSARSHSRSLSNRATHTSYLLLYFACYSRSASEFMGIYRSLPLDLQLHDRVQFALTVLRAIRRCDYVRLRDIWDTAQAEDRVFLEDVLASQRQKTFGVLRKAYYTYPTKMLQKYLVFSTTEEMTDFLGKNLGEESLAERIKGETVHLRIPKRR